MAPGRGGFSQNIPGPCPDQCGGDLRHPVHLWLDAIPVAASGHQFQRNEHHRHRAEKMISFADADTPWNLVMVTSGAGHPAADPVVVLMQRWFVRVWSRRRNKWPASLLNDVRKAIRAIRSSTASPWTFRWRIRGDCQARPAAASPRFCAWSPARRSPAGTIEIGGKVVNKLEPRTRHSPWYSRTTRFTRICRLRENHGFTA